MSTDTKLPLPDDLFGAVFPWPVGSIPKCNQKLPPPRPPRPSQTDRNVSTFIRDVLVPDENRQIEKERVVRGYKVHFKIQQGLTTKKAVRLDHQIGSAFDKKLQSDESQTGFYTGISFIPEHPSAVELAVPELPFEILEHVGKFCDVVTLSFLAQVSPVFSQIFNQDKIWIGASKKKPSSLPQTISLKKWILSNTTKKCFYCYSKKTEGLCELMDVPVCFTCHKAKHISKTAAKTEYLLLDSEIRGLRSEFLKCQYTTGQFYLESDIQRAALEFSDAIDARETKKRVFLQKKEETRAARAQKFRGMLEKKGLGLGIPGPLINVYDNFVSSGKGVTLVKGSIDRHIEIQGLYTQFGVSDEEIEGTFIQGA
jgi:hypothetical protein